MRLSKTTVRLVDTSKHGREVLAVALNRVAQVCAGWVFLAGFSVATCVGQEIASIADLKADLGFPQRAVRCGDLGLKEKEVLEANLFDSPLQKGKFAFDEKMLMMAMAGLLNRNEPLVFLNATPCGWRGDATWLQYYGTTHRYRFTHLDHGLPDLIRRTARSFNGIVLYEPAPSDNIWLAMNLASLNFCLPVSQRIYDQYKQEFADVPVVVRLRENTLNREQIYDWMVREVLPRTDRTAAYTPAADFPDIKLYAGWEEVALGLDYPFYRKNFMFNISPLAERVPGFGGADGSHAMARQYREIMQALTPPAAIFGWSVGEAEFSQFGHFQCNSVVATNLSFHAGVKPLEGPPFRQDHTPRINEPEKKVYLSFAANEGDTLVVLTQLYYSDGWLDPGRGRVALNWSVNPYYASLFPALVEYYFRTKTDKDYFVCCPSGAGYVHPDSMSKPDLDRFIAMTNHWMKAGITLREIILWEARDPDVWESYARGIPELRGMTTKPEEMYPYGEMLATSTNVPVLREPIPTQYWHINGRFINKESSKPFDVKVDQFLKFLDELDQRVEKPYCVMVYGLQNNLPTEIARIQDAMDRKRFEIVDMGTLCHLARFQSGKIRQATAQLLDPDNYQAVKPTSDQGTVWTLERIARADGWQPVEDALISADQRGMRVEIGPNRQWGRAVLSNVLLPVGASRVRVKVSDVHGCHWAVRLATKVDSGPIDVADIQGVRRERTQASWCPFSEWSSHRRWPGSEERSLDKAFVIARLRGEPVTVTFEVAGGSGGFAVFEGLEFIP